MLRYLIEVTTTLLPTFIVIGMLSGLVVRRDLASRRAIFWGGFLGLLLALTMATIRLSTGRIIREYYDLWVLVPSIALELILIVYLIFGWGNKLASYSHRVVLGLLFLTSCGWMAYAIPDLFFFPFQFSIGMEGFVNTEFMIKSVGYLAGLFLTWLSYLAAKRILSSLHNRLGLTLYSLALLVLFSKQMLSVCQIAITRRFIPSKTFLTRYVMYMINRVDWYLFGLLAIGFFAAVLLFMICRRPASPADNPAQARKFRHHIIVQKRWCVVLTTCLIVSLLTVTVGVAYENKKVELSPPLEIAVKDGIITLPLEKISDGRLHRFLYNCEDGTAVRYIVIKKSEFAYGVGLDACDVCGASGYYERGDQVVCILCDVVMNKSTIGFPGGCNPVPLAYDLADGAMQIQVTNLEKEKRRFQ